MTEAQGVLSVDSALPRALYPRAILIVLHVWGGQKPCPWTQGTLRAILLVRQLLLAGQKPCPLRTGTAEVCTQKSVDRNHAPLQRSLTDPVATSHRYLGSCSLRSRARTGPRRSAKEDARREGGCRDMPLNFRTFQCLDAQMPRDRSHAVRLLLRGSSVSLKERKLGKYLHAFCYIFCVLVSVRSI